LCLVVLQSTAVPACATVILPGSTIPFALAPNSCQMACAMRMAITFMLASGVVQANQYQCSSGGECPSDDEPTNILSVLQTKLQMNVLEDPPSVMTSPNAMPTELGAMVHSGENHTDIKQEVTCEQGYVWLLVTEGKPPPPHIAKNVPKGMCVQHLQRLGGKTFWEGRTRAVLKYLQEQPRVEFVVLTDTDVYVNPLSLDDVKFRFEKIATPTARVAVSTEQTCWFGHICTEEEANDWLRVVRASNPAGQIIQHFLNSQYMGEAKDVKYMLERELEIYPEDDQRALSLLIKEHPDRFALDLDETLFVSMARGMVRLPPPEGKYMCNFGGMETASCGFPEADWGSCDYADGSIKVTHWNWTGTLRQAKELLPLVIHANGPWRKGIAHGRHCAEALGNVE